MPAVLSLAEVGPGMQAGAKAETLAKLARAGLPVVDGFVVMPEAARRLDLPDVAAIARALEALGAQAVAVRSSATEEDGVQASHAGQLDSALEVRGLDDVVEAIRRVVRSATAAHVSAYRRDVAGTSDPAATAVLIQRWIEPVCSGVAFSDGVVHLAAVRGRGDGVAVGGEEWVIDGEAAQASDPSVLTSADALEIAGLARRVEELAGVPQDIEWCKTDRVHLLQARPITGAQREVAWHAPAGSWARDFRLGEWMTGPLTPLFATWLLPGIEDGLARAFERHFGFAPRPPHHVLLHGWYFASLNFLPRRTGDLVAMLGRELLPRFVRRPRWVSVALPALAGFGVGLHVRDWRERILPRYRTLTAMLERTVDCSTDDELFAQVDAVARAAGEYFASMTIVAGYAWKAELPLAEFLASHGSGDAHARLLTGFGAGSVRPHAVTHLDWAHPTLAELGYQTPATTPATATARRRAAEAEVRASLPPRRRATFDRLLERAQRFARLREEQSADLTLPWPGLRRAVQRLGLRAGTEVEPFFLELDELRTTPPDVVTRVNERRRLWQRQRTLTPPLVLGSVPPLLASARARGDALFRGAGAEAELHGLGASPGQGVGRVRLIRGPEDFPRLVHGEVLVAPALAPAWAALFGRAAAVVADSGSVLAHASIVAREFGVPAVIATGDATRRLQNGQIVLVDGTSGRVTVRG
jgi:phosphohistidine swiveling domain-containing protein